MTKEQYRIAIEALGLKHQEAASFLGTCKRTSQGWASGLTRIPGATAKLLWTMVAKGLKPADVDQIADRFRR